MAKSEQVNPEDLGLEQLVAFAPNLRIRHEIDRYLRQLGITMRIAAELDNIDSVKHALEVDSAIAFLPEPTVKEEIESGSLVALKCPWLDLTRPLGVIQRRSCMLGRTARGVLELILADADKPEVQKPAMNSANQCAESQAGGIPSPENNKRQVAVT